MKKKLLLLICTVAFLLTPFSTFTAFAASNGVNAVDMSAKGSVDITVKADDTPVSGAVFSAYAVANAKLSGNGVSFELTDAFTAFGSDVNDIDTSSELNELAEYAKKNNVSAIEKTTDESGNIVFDNLKLATYLIVQTGKTPGYSKCDPFLVAIPFYENGNWVYNADASPKAELQKLCDITISKVWNDGKSSDSHKSVKIKLLKNGKTVKTVTLDKDNNWTQTLTDMPQSDSYSVKEINVPDGYSPVYSKSEMDFTVTNNQTLIKTGQLVWPIPVLAGAGLLLIIIGVYSIRRSKTDA